MKHSKNKQVTPLTNEQQKLVTDHMSFANNMAKRYAGLGRSKGISFEEILSDACFGLCEAALRYKANEGATFQTYAYDWCKKYILMHINENAFYSDKDITDMEDDIPEDDGEEQQERKKKVAVLMSVLNNKEREVICLFYGFDGREKTFREIALLLRVHPARVHQIYENAMTKMEFNKQ